MLSIPSVKVNSTWPQWCATHRIVKRCHVGLLMQDGGTVRVLASAYLRRIMQSNSVDDNYCKMAYITITANVACNCDIKSNNYVMIFYNGH